MLQRVAVIMASWQVRSHSWGRRDLFAVMRLSWEKKKKRFSHKALFQGSCVKNSIFQDALVGLEEQYAKQKAGIPENTTGGGRGEKERYCRAKEQKMAKKNTTVDSSKKGEKRRRREARSGGAEGRGG